MRKRELVAVLTATRDKLEEKERTDEAWEQRARTMHYELRQERRARDELKGRYDNALALLGQAQAQNERLARQIEKLQDRMIDLAARPPHIVDTSDAITKITAGLRDILAPATTVDPNSYAENYPMGEHVGEVDPFAATRFFIPPTEQDEAWNGPAPIPGEWSATTPSVLREGETPSHAMGPMGTLQRTDGQPMFQAGVGAPPPEGGVE